MDVKLLKNLVNIHNLEIASYSSDFSHYNNHHLFIPLIDEKIIFNF